MTLRSYPVMLMTLGLMALTVASLFMGSYGLGLSGVWQALTGASEGMDATVVLEFRLPRLIVALLTGGLMAVSGCILQAVTRNDLADPSLLGVSHGAALATVALIVLLPTAPYALRTPAAFGGALLATALVQMVTAQGGPMRLVLSGIGMSSLLAALISAILTQGKLQEASAALGWLSGSVNTASWAEVRSLTIVAIALIPCVALLARPLGVLRFGAEVATGLGLPVTLARRCALGVAVIAAASATAAVGPLAFVGLIAPHMAARVARTGMGGRLMLSSMTGALTVGIADLVGRMAFAPIQIPAGLVTSIIGVPVFVAILHRHNR